MHPEGSSSQVDELAAWLRIGDSVEAHARERAARARTLRLQRSIALATCARKEEARTAATLAQV